MFAKRNIIILFFGVIIGISISVGQVVFADRKTQTQVVSLPLEELRAFSEVFARIKGSYVEEVEDKVLIENAIRGMLSGLDPHSSYLDAEAFKELQVGTRGEFGGLGIEVGMEDGFVKVIAPIDDTPAQKAGLKSGDLIIRLDNKSVKGMTLNDAVKLMRGKPGSPILLTVVRKGVDKPLEIKIVRAIIKVKSVKSRLLDEGYGYVRITTFQSRTGSDLYKAVDKLKKESKQGMKGLILDLRNNPGGVLSAAVEVSDAFVRSGLIVYTDGRVGDAKMRFKATDKDILDGAPIVVLVNGGSASASEIVSGALQDHKRAIIMGEKTFGKGSVQTILPMNKTAALKLTTARYYTPSGRSIQAEGIMPDIVLDNIKVTSGEEHGKMIKEADLSGHLSNGNGDKKKSATKNAELKVSELASSDYPLFEALNLLKGMHILKVK